MSLTVVVAFDREAWQVLSRHRPGHPLLENVSELEAVADANEVAEALRASGHRVTLLPLDRDAVAKLAALDQARPDLVFNLCDTLRGRGSLAPLVPGALELLGIPYTGASAAGQALSKRKHEVKRELERAGLPTPRYQVLGSRSELASFALSLEPPVLVKPSHEHASIGIEPASICFDVHEVRARAEVMFARLGGSVLVEEYVAGREVFISLVGDPARPLGLMEQRYSELAEGFLPLRTFEVKWFGSESPLVARDPRWAAPVPTRTPSVPFSGSLDDLPDICGRAFELGGARDWGRVDVRVDAHSRLPFIIDVTPNTYLSQTSPCANAAFASGLSYPELVETIARGAVARGCQ